MSKDTIKLTGEIKDVDISWVKRLKPGLNVFKSEVTLFEEVIANDGEIKLSTLYDVLDDYFLNKNDPNYVYEISLSKFFFSNEGIKRPNLRVNSMRLILTCPELQPFIEKYIKKLKLNNIITGK